MRRLKLHSRYSILPSEQGGCWIWLRGFDEDMEVVNA